MRAVVPCHNRPDDLAALLGDFAAMRLGGIGFDVIVVDNASDQPLGGAPGGIDVEFLRLDTNLGGSGGYNAGMARALRRDGAKPDLLWLVDSDARVDPDTLTLLVEALDRDERTVAVGPALCDTASGEVFEIGGCVEPWGGGFEPVYRSFDTLDDADEPFECDYVAACCALVRATAVERVGLFPEVFLNGDDVEWFIRLVRETGGRVLCHPEARAYHPRFDRVPTAARYFLARNAYGAIAAKGYGALVRWRRAWVEASRALNQAVMGRNDLARLHLLGLADAAAGRVSGPSPRGRLVFEPFHPFTELAERVRALVRGARTVTAVLPANLGDDAEREIIEQLDQLGRHVEVARAHDQRTTPVRRGLLGFVHRAVFGPGVDVAITPAKGRPEYWLGGRVMVQLAESGFVVRRVDRFGVLLRAGWTWLVGNALALRIALRGPAPTRLPGVDEVAAADLPESVRAPAAVKLSVVILSYNRQDALARTLSALRADPACAWAELIVVDNASTDGSPDFVRERFAGVRVIALDKNEGVEGFNHGARAARGEYLLILDDDAVPDEGALARAIAALDADDRLAAVTLEPRHPGTDTSEWAFAGRVRTPRDDWPVMGCANLVRRRDWLAAGGYERGFFLYRNDTDLAMKLLAMGRGVRFDPALIAWHDSPAAASKSVRWLRLATRNWVWLCTRHGRGWSRVAAIVMGLARAHGAARWRINGHLAVLRGASAGLFCRAPALPVRVKPDGNALRALLRLRTAR